MVHCSSNRDKDGAIVGASIQPTRGLTLPFPKATINDGGEGAHLPSLQRTTTSRQFERDFQMQAQTLGSGVSGIVRPAVCRSTGKRFAVKTFRKAMLSARAYADMRREIEIHQSLHHPHIVRLEQVYECVSEIHLVMELMEGGDLFQQLEEQGQFTEAQVARSMRQLLEAVAYLHARGLTHRDLKLENVLCENRGTQCLRLNDFGFATQVGEAALTRRCGTLQYVAPEVLRGVYTQKADLWSLGAMAYTMLTGMALYMGDETMVKERILAGHPHWSKRFDCISVGARDFVNSFLVPDPNQRLSAADGLRHPWLTQYTDTTGDFGSMVLRSCGRENTSIVFKGIESRPQCKENVAHNEFDGCDVGMGPLLLLESSKQAGSWRQICQIFGVFGIVWSVVSKMVGVACLA